ncbi:pyrroline-5-carboxylate reductase [Clostridium acidisoli DSM 12555]|uniref:Pyrroline-5-carboxylate reductase n=1 Tax=Clostridium acidisoli DSM 12555 TaxID=1121291 RepID=A0A1W1XUP0_9CLOT|nr:pyrroline-5-carboxylate reductase [Clostridium acidisoli]SMC27616.1 pyrroline-5-carboxylate reductase [Clostridium acidisoli DSM 12555]
MLNNKISFIGGGNMAEGIIRGLISTSVLSSDNIKVYDILEERLEYLYNTYKVHYSTTAADAAKNADVLFIAVRPQDIFKVTESLKDSISENTTIISICAGIKLEKLKELFGANHKLVRVMPNTMIDVQHGYSAVSTNDKVSKEDKAIVQTILSSLGQTMFLQENMFNAFTAYSCAGPAYVMYFIAGLIDAGVQSGFSRKDATSIALENIIASALTIKETGKHPYQITDSMTSPAGITIDGLHYLSEAGFHGIVMSSVKSALNRTNELE